MKEIIFLITITACCPTFSYSQPGRLDPTFGNNGIVSSTFGPLTDISSNAQQVLTAQDGTIYVIVEKGIIIRFLANGTIDSSYGKNGYSQPIFITPTSGVLQSDGKIVVAGAAASTYYDGGLLRNTINLAVARYNTDGTFDTTFSKDGKDIAYIPGAMAQSVALQSDGKIVVVGTTNDGAALVRYNLNGTMDTTFSKDGKEITDFGTSSSYSSVAIQKDGKIVVSTAHALGRYNTDGTLDTTFSGDGKQTTDFDDRTGTVVIQTDGKIVAAGYINDGVNSDFVFARYNTDGSLDSSFSDDGKVVTDFGGSSLTIQSDGKIVAAGYSRTYPPDFAIARYNADGSPDTTFSEDGKQITDFASHADFAESLVIQSDGKIVAAGYTNSDKGSDFLDFALARYNINGTLDKTFAEGGKLTDRLHAPNTFYNSTALQSDGKIVVGGSVLARYNSDGTLDTSFATSGYQTPDFTIVDIAIQSDGKIVAGTYVDTIALARYNVDGTPDTTFSGANYLAVFGARQTDGKIVTADYIQLGEDCFGFGVSRYNTNGTLDTTFSNDGKQTTEFIDLGVCADPSSVTLQSDGKILVAGDSYACCDLPGGDFVIARYNTDGALDTTFSADGRQIIHIDRKGNFFTHTGKVSSSSVAVQNDGRIIIAGSSENEAGRNFTLVRLISNGSLDSTFGENGKQVTEVSEGDDVIRDIVIAGRKLYAVGSARYIGLSGVVAKYLLDDDNGNKVPSVTLSIPFNIVKYSAPARIKLNATATDEDGTITKVQFFNGTTRLHTEDVYPYGFLWIDVPVGNYTLTAKAFDNSGNVTTSNVIRVSVIDDNVPPVVSIVTPVDNATYSGPANIQLSANAKDPNDRIRKVDFYNGRILLHTENIYPYTFVWKDVPEGTYTLTAKAFDEQGLPATSEAVKVTVTAASAITTVSKKASAITSLDLKGAVSLKVRPIPTSNTLNIVTTGMQQNKQTTISVISSSGIIIKTIQSNISNQVVPLDVSTFGSGVYTIKVVCGDKVMYRQFVKL